MNSGGVSDPTPMNVRHYEYADTNRIDIEIQFTFPQYKTFSIGFYIISQFS
jgi:hypothetical protein